MGKQKWKETKSLLKCKRRKKLYVYIIKAGKIQEPMEIKLQGRLNKFYSNFLYNLVI